MNVHYTVVWSNCGCCAANSDGAALFEVVATLPSHGLLALSVAHCICRRGVACKCNALNAVAVLDYNLQSYKL
jgi:hypothetical protein